MFANLPKKTARKCCTKFFFITVFVDVILQLGIGMYISSRYEYMIYLSIFEKSLVNFVEHSVRRYLRTHGFSLDARCHWCANPQQPQPSAAVSAESC